MVPKPHGAVGPAHGNFTLAHTARFLKWHIPVKPGNVLLRGGSIEECKGRIPCRRNDAIRAHVGRQVMREGDKGIGAVRALRSIDRVPHAIGVDIESRARKPPSLPRHAAGHLAHETQTALMEGAESLQAHHMVWLTRGNCVSGALFHEAPPFHV